MKRSIVVIILFALCSMCLSQAQEIVWRSELPKGFIDVEATDSGDKVAVLAPSGIWFYRTSLHSTKPNTNRYIRNDTSVIRGNMDSSWRILLHPTVEKAFVSVGLNVYSCNVDTTANPYGFYSFKATAPKLSDAPFGNIAKYVDHSNHLFVYPGIEYGTPDFQQAGYAFNPVSDSIERYGYVIAQNPKTHDKLLREIRFQYHKYNIIAYRDTLKIVTSKHSRIVRYVDAHPDDCIITDDGQYIIYKDKVHHWSSSTDVRTNAPIGVVLSSRFKAYPSTSNKLIIWDLHKSANFDTIASFPTKVTVLRKLNSGRLLLVCTSDSSYLIRYSELPSLVIGIDFTGDREGRMLKDTLRFTNTTYQIGDYDYEWDYGDGTRTKTLHGEHVYRNAGIYDVRLIARPQNGTDSLVMQRLGYVTILGVSSIDDDATIPDTSVTVSPNPATSEVHVHVSHPMEGRIVNALGETVAMLDRIETQAVDCSAWAQGMYYVLLRNRHIHKAIPFAVMK